MRSRPIKPNLFYSGAVFRQRKLRGYFEGFGSYASKGRAGEAKLIRSLMSLSQTSCESHRFQQYFWTCWGVSGPAWSRGFNVEGVMRSCWPKIRRDSADQNDKELRCAEKRDKRDKRLDKGRLTISRIRLWGLQFNDGNECEMII